MNWSRYHPDATVSLATGHLNKLKILFSAWTEGRVLHAANLRVIVRAR